MASICNRYYYVFGFIASFIDSVVGGGGLISTPALLAVGLPPSIALGTNKFASSFSTLTSAFKFIRSGKVDLKVVGKLFPFIFIASGAGAILATYLREYIKATHYCRFNDSYCIHYCKKIGVVSEASLHLHLLRHSFFNHVYHFRIL